MLASASIDGRRCETREMTDEWPTYSAPLPCADKGIDGALHMKRLLRENRVLLRDGERRDRARKTAAGYDRTIVQGFDVVGARRAVTVLARLLI
jgi:hypothetical protein